MNKALFFVLIIFATASCDFKSNGKSKHTSGKINYISVIIDDQLWNGAVGDSIRTKFAAPVVGLQQEEPQFTINQYPVRLLEGFMTTARNIIVVKKENANDYSVVENEYASPQTVFRISGKTSASIIELLQKHSSEITKTITANEMAENRRQIDTALIDTKSILKDFGVKMNIPSGFVNVLQKPKFVWYKREIMSGSLSILIYEIPIKSFQNSRASTINNIIKMRDSIGALYINGSAAETPMITEPGFAPFLANTKIDGHFTYETKGTWELKNEFMSGPFVNYSIMDKPNNRMLIIEGFCYAPSKDKRDLVFCLKTIIESSKLTSENSKK